MRKIKKSIISLALTTAMISSLFNNVAFAYDSVEVSDGKVYGYNNGNSMLNMELYGRYNSGALCEDGGSMEIVEYNSVNGYAYAVSGLKGTIVSMKLYGMVNDNSVTSMTGKDYDVKSLVEGVKGVEGFVYGDTTSIAISPDGTKLAASIQHSEYDKAGVVAVFDCNEDGTISNPQLYGTGVQPDMVTFAGNDIILTADEGEPREGYGEGTVDPAGTVSVINIEDGTSKQAGFDNFKTEELTAKNIIVGVANGKILEPKYDLEPEYIAVSSDGSRAYVALQEANAIGVLDLSGEEPVFTDIYSAGYEDYSRIKVDINKDDKAYNPNVYTDIIGARMPDGITIYENNGKTYILTANEGDSRDWTDYCNEAEDTSIIGEDAEVIFLDGTKCSGIPEGKKVLFGGRSFTIFEVTDAGISEVYDSEDGFEKITAKLLPDNFNCSNDKKKIDNRSGKKGPEPENITIGTVGTNTYAFIAIQRIGGVMVYDITNPSEAKYVNYINSRDFSDNIKGDVSPEGICFVQDNGNGRAAIIASCEVSGTVAVYELSDSNEADNKNNVVVLYTNDVHNAYVRDGESLGYAALETYKKQLQSAGYTVILADGGDAIQGGVIGTLSKGQYIADIMENMGYDIAVPGNHEFDFGMDTFLNIAESVSYDYVSCNFVDLKTGEAVFDEYKIMDFNGTKVAYIGITTPETFIKSTPTYFQDENGNYIYGFCEGDNGNELYNKVQESIDAAKAEGADYIIAIGHIGTDKSSSPWTSQEIISHTTGLDAFLDGHSHSTIASESVTDKAGKTVVLCSTGTKLNAIGQLIINTADGTVAASLVDSVQFDDGAVLNYTNKITEKFEALQNQVVAKTEVDLVINNPETGDRMIRNQETNLGDLCADAYRQMLGADIAFVNGGGIRVDVTSGDITYGDIVSVHPFGNTACLIEATGQQILDALEMGSKSAGESESGGFLQVSGLTYEIDTTITSSVICDDKGAFVKVDGAYRVKNVMVGDEPLDLNKTYKLASHNYMLKSGGDGFSMFKNNKILLDEVMIDNQVLINYIVDELGGVVKADSIYSDIYGNGRIKVIVDYKEPTATEEGYQDILRGDKIVREILPATGSTDNNDTTTETPKTEDDKLTDNVPKTGDNDNAYIYLIMALAAFAALSSESVSKSLKSH